ncbi:hypothetical protein GF371_05105 [Candidatus Woesearchaeota archaeon]|nr:hypothetical protein [Candidatus Woesearchaeota archaeon]
MKKLNRKAQLTLYIIIGIIILLAAILIIYLTLSTQRAEIERAAPEISTLPLSYRTVELFITDCLGQTAETGLRELGAHGGWISVRDPLLPGKEFNIDILKPFDSDAVPLDKLGNNLVPYWWHLKTPYGCGGAQPCFATQENIPTIGEIEKQLNLFIEDRLPECFQAFSELKEQGFEIEERGELKVTSKILLDDVIFYLDYPLKITKGSEIIETETFAKPIDLDLRQIYNQAFAVSFEEMDGQFLENHLLLNLISLYSGVDFTKLPPIAASTEGFDTVIWPKALVELRIKNLISLYAPFMRINGTANAERLTSSDQIVQGVYDSLYFNIFENYTFPNTDINFLYLDWPVDFHVTPPRGPGILKPKSYKTEYPFGILQPTQRNLYEFFYDVSFPVVVEIYDSEAFNGKGYSFFFALEGNILDNKNMLDWNRGMGTVAWDSSVFDIEINPDASGYQPAPQLGQLPNVSTQVYVNVTAPKTAETLFDKFEQKISNITIYTKDKKTDSYIEDVSVELICGNYRSASLGSTELLESGKSGLVTKAPICYGDGRLRFDKLGYDPLTIGSITTSVGGDQVVTAELEPVREQEISFRKVLKIVPSGENLTFTSIDPPQALQIFEKAVVVLEKVPASPYDSKLSVAANFETPDNQVIEIPPGEYSLTVILMDKRNVTIQPDKRTFEADDEEITIMVPPEPLDFAELISGGLEYTTGTCGTFTIHDYELDQGNVLELRAFLIKRPVKIEDVSEIGKIAEYTNTSCTTLRPRFI